MAEKGRVQVFARCRPPLPREQGDKECLNMDSDAKKVKLNVVDGDAVDRVLAGGDFNIKGSTKEFSFDGVMDPHSSQKEVFSLVGKPVLKDVMMGYNGAILAYGQTGAGKTHSLLNGGGKAPAEAGLLPRTVAALYVYIGGDEAHVHTVQAAAFQIYNEQIDDLLVEDRSVGTNLTVKAGGEVHNLTWVTCKSPDELLKHFQTARQNVIYAETKMNKASSRSHSVFQIKVSKRVRATENKGSAVKMAATVGKLTVVDLAGSERVKRSGVEGKNLKEAANINTSLLAFGNVVQALADKKKHVPFRDSKLTRVIEDSVGGNCKTSLLVCCSPSEESCSETLGTLDFAARAMRVETCASVNETQVVVDAKGLAADLAGEGIDEAVRAKAKEMQNLQKELASKEAAAKAQDQKWKKAAMEAKAQDQQRIKEQNDLVAKMKKELVEASEKQQSEKAALQQRMEELEAEVKDAREGHEAKAKVVEMEAVMEDLQDQLQKARSQADLSQASLAQKLQATEAAQEAEIGKRTEMEVKLQEAEGQLKEVTDELELQKTRLRDMEEQARQDLAVQAKTQQATLKTLQERQAEETRALEVKYQEAQAALLEEHKGELAALQAQQSIQLFQREQAFQMEMHEQEERAEAAMQNMASQLKAEAEAALYQKDMELQMLNELGANKDLTIQSLHTQSQDLERQVDSTRGEMRAQADEFRAEVARVWEVAAQEQAEVQRKAEEQIKELELRHSEHAESLTQQAHQQQRRQSGAFSAARSLLAHKMEALENKMRNIQSRFDARESRQDDINRIKQLEKELRGAKNLERQQSQLASQLKMQLDNRDNNDMVFGGTFGGENFMAKKPSLSRNLGAGKLEPLNPVKVRDPKRTFVSTTGFKR